MWGVIALLGFLLAGLHSLRPHQSAPPLPQGSLTI